MTAYCQVYGVIHFTSPAGCTPGPAPGPTLGNEYGKTFLLFYLKKYVAIMTLPHLLPHPHAGAYSVALQAEWEYI